MKIAIIITIGLSLAGCAAAIPFGVGAAVGTVLTNQNNQQPDYIPPRPKR
jgi:hypothetical protein